LATARLCVSPPSQVRPPPRLHTLSLHDALPIYEAIHIGLADVRVEQGAALEAALKHARRLAAGPPLAQATIKRLFTALPVDLVERLRVERETAAETFASEDFVEGASAFLEKRRPHFRGC